MDDVLLMCYAFVWGLDIRLLVGYRVYILYTNSSIDMMYNIVE